MKLTVIILTFNEALHIERCIKSVHKVASRIVVVDSYSNDETLAIVEKLGVELLQRKFDSHSSQFNWALSSLGLDGDWVMRLDADEYLSEELQEEILEKIDSIPKNVSGLYVNRFIVFRDKKIRFGGIFPLKVLRIFRAGSGGYENRLMDEHLQIVGDSIFLDGALIDHNLNSITWWISKHNNYASLEAIDILNQKYKLTPLINTNTFSLKKPHEVKRWLKQNIYLNLPKLLRCFMYFIYRYFINFGFLDGSSGFSFHFLQGFWYRYLVDLKVSDIENYAFVHKCSIKEAMQINTRIKVE